MTDVTSYRTDVVPALGAKCVFLTTGTTLTGATDTVTLTLADYGFKRILGFKEYVHTTDYSVIIAGASPTVSVTNGVATFVTTTGNNSKRRVFVVWGE